ncbi:MAG: beta-N-acetylhexosaminidase [Beijerinckiaceae bacterium]
MSTRALIVGCTGKELTREEKAFFKAERPWGFILFKRNIETPDQVRKLVDSFRKCVDWDNAPVLIDQEGGRVQRLGPPHWPVYPTGRAYGRVHSNDSLIRREVARLGARLMAHDLLQLGINVDCVPVLDVPVPGAHDVIGDRAYSTDPKIIAQLGRAAAEGLIAGGVLPVIKHIPGHGRAGADSHLALPVVETDHATLSATDFMPFRHLADMPMAMTAHVVYTAIDAKRPATTSRKVMRKIIRGEIGFAGLVMSDDLSMKALAGDFESRTKAAFKAGCDMALHCNGDMAEMKAILSATPELAGKAKRRADAAMNRIANLPEPFDPVEGRARLDAALATIV